MGGPYVDAIRPDESLPEEAAVVIVGGGIIGVSAALWLARRGVSVVLCEKGHVAGEQSSRNWGWCRQAGRDEREMALMAESIRRWRTMAETVGADVGYDPCGTLYVARNEAEEQGFHEWLAMAAPYDTQARLVHGAELQALMPGATQSFRCGLYVPSDGRAEPQWAVPAMARAAQAAGARIVTQCSVLGLERSAGRVSAVVTSRGNVRCDAVLLAGGVWSSALCATLGVTLPQLKVLGSVMRTAPLQGGPETCGWVDSWGYRKRRDGGYTLGFGGKHLAPLVPDSLRFLGAFLPLLRQNWKTIRPHADGTALREWVALLQGDQGLRDSLCREPTLDPAPNPASLRQVLAEITALYPVFREARVVQRWAGYIDVTPDLIPYIDEVEACPGLTVATGFSGHGFGIGPAAGELAAATVIGQSSTLASPAFRASRFADGSPVLLGAEI